MADGVFGVEVVTPEQSLFAGGATSVVLATSEGALTVLDGHTPLVGDVVPGEVKVEQPDGTLLRLAVHGGFLQVDTSPGAAEGLAEGDGPLPGLSTRVTVLAGVAELAEEIDVPRAELARETATQRVNELGGGTGARPRGHRGGRRARRGGACTGAGRVAAGGGRAGSAGADAAGPDVRSSAQPNEIELNSASLASAWLASILRSVPDLERITSDCVVAPNSWYCTPWRSSPSVIPVAAKKQLLPWTRSSVVRTASRE